MKIDEPKATWLFRSVVISLLGWNIWATYQTEDTADQARREAAYAKAEASYCLKKN